METDASVIANSRFQILDVPAAAPGKCAVCGFAGREYNRQYVDFGMSLDFYGVVYFCTDCLKAAAVRIGMSDEHSVEEINVLRRFYDSKIEELRTLLAGDYLESYRDILIEHFTAIRNLLPVSNSSSSDGDSEDESAGTTGTKQGRRTTSKQRSNDVPVDTSDGTVTFDFPSD